MGDLTLIIGNKRLSSWSLRPWLLLTHAGIPFREDLIILFRDDHRQTLTEKSPSALVPALKDGALTIWDSLAIAEYINDRFPEKNLWPADPSARAIARSVSAEMHSGFQALRTVWPMYATRRNLAHLTTGGVKRDIARIIKIWTECRTNYGADGPFLFGAFSIADAMYAPVVSRFMTYGPIAAPDLVLDYMKTIDELPAMRAWIADAEKEPAPPLGA